ncbi:hypothetical protein [Tsukamurella ocularis]|uniref:hypothetical protein n=1 Tax=Tsukamurella ocularis TaxID=1970234 RepID=UPI002167DE1F|nr:hypothetical protein [Tsukamurella ocularis]MCS3782214.1 hypothetical protein [Tsukamurella ocularis]MCS3789626.1 hypothetical protein [Tsukamurella ocularis]MCS3852773.1 hypothetical protein [Tsukamurella ocularis]
MLLAALGATVIGFILLIVALVTSNLWLAIACVVVSVIGVGLLLGDVLTYRRGDRDKADSASAQWSPGDRDDDADEPPSERSARAVASPESDTEAEEPVVVDDAAREAGTVGHEEFGHHDDDANPTTQFAMGPLGGPTGWEHESPTDTDDDATRGLFAPGKYDPDMTDQIPQIRIDQAWGTEWTPPQEPESEDPGKK